MIELPLNETAVVEEIVGKITKHEKSVYNIMTERDLFISMYRGTPRVLAASSYSGINYKKDDGMARTSVPTTSEAVETLTAAIFAMLTAADPNFELVSTSGNVDSSTLFKNTTLLRMQMDKIKKNGKLLKAIRSTVLNGTSFVEMPYVSFPGGSDPAWEATDFVPRSFSNMFWSPAAVNLRCANFMGTLDITTAAHIKAMEEMDDQGATWSKENVAEALKESENESFTPTEVRSRLTRLGYSDFEDNLELTTYYGPVEASDQEGEMVVGIINRKYLVRFHPNPYPYGMRPYLFGHHIEFEDDPLGIGVGHQMKDTQKWINSNMNRTMDIITFGLFHMFLASRYAGLKSQDMRIRPWHVIEADDISENAIRRLTTDPNAAALGMKLHEALVGEAKANTGATSTLEATISDASASEVRLAQNNSMRRVSNIATVLADEFIREHILFSQYNNALFLDSAIWLHATGMQKPMVMYPTEVLKDIGVTPRTITDKDFAPAMIKNSLSLLQILTSIRNMIPEDIDVRPIVSEVVRRLGVDPGRVFVPRPQLPQINSRQMPQMANQQARAGYINKEMAMAQPPASQAEATINSQAGVNQINAMGS